jgi:MinD-like ATPase involved in chromosome partitioning or flagellar assembly
MTENSDFMARYLRPDNATRREHPARPADETTEEVRMPEPQMGQPEAPAPPPAAPPATGPGGEGSHGQPAPPPGSPGTGPQPSAAAAAAAAQRWSVAPGRGQNAQAPVNNGPHTGAAPAQRPDQRPQPPNGGQRWAPPPDPGARWAPRVDPAERWAPRADPRTAGAQPHRHIQVDEVVKARREPPEMGWRKVVYAATGHLVNLGAGPAERTLRDQKARITANIPGNYQIAAMSVKGGVGKTRVVAGVGTVFADLRKQQVIAIDADTTYGGLGRFIDPNATTSVVDFLAAKDVVDYPRARFYTGQNKQGLEVLAGNQNVANPLDVDAQTFFSTISRTRRFYQLALVDCGAEIEHQVVPAVLSASDALMIVGTCNVEGGLAVETTIDWLAARNGHELLKRSVIVLNDIYRCANKKFITHITQTLGPRVRSVKTIPWDPHLRDAATFDFEALSKPTKRALIDLAAELASGFPTAGALAG